MTLPDVLRALGVFAGAGVLGVMLAWALARPDAPTNAAERRRLFLFLGNRSAGLVSVFYLAVALLAWLTYGSLVAASMGGSAPAGVLLFDSMVRWIAGGTEDTRVSAIWASAAAPAAFVVREILRAIWARRARAELGDQNIPAPRRTMRERLRGGLRLLKPASHAPWAIFNKEVRSQGRRRGTYVMRALYAGLLVVVVGITFLAFAAMQSEQNESPANRLQELQHFAPATTLTVLWVQFVGLTLMAPMMLASSISDEKRTGTLGTLMTTPLTAGQIVLGKLSGGLVQVLILAMIPTPMLLVIRIFGGVPAMSVVSGLAVALCFGVLTAAIALRLSVTLKHGATAAIGAIVAAVALNGAPALAAVILTGLRIYVVPNWFYPVTSAPGSMIVLSIQMTDGQTPAGEWFWLGNVAYNLLLTCVFVLWASLLLRRTMLKEEENSTHADPLDPSAAKVSKKKAGALAKEAARVRDVGDSPVLWREVRRPAVSARKGVLITGIVLGAVFMAWIYSIMSPHDEELHAVIMTVGSAITLLMAIAFPGGSIAGERDARTWETLMTTPLPARDIVLGKAAGALKRLWVAPALMLAHIVLYAVLVAGMHWSGPVLLLSVLLPPVLFLTGTGVLASLIFRRPVQATLATLAVALFLWVGVPLILVLLEEFSRRVSPFSGDSVRRFLIGSNPAPMLVTIGEGLTDTVRTNGPKSLRFHLPGRHTGFGGLLPYLAAYGVSYTAAGAGMLWLACSLFTRFSGRSS